LSSAVPKVTQASFWKPEWAFVAGYSGATPGIQFPHPPPDVFTDFMTFLDCVACWIMERSLNAHTGLACEAVCGANRVWSGVCTPFQSFSLWLVRPTTS
jgi:hypothetical protein